MHPYHVENGDSVCQVRFYKQELGKTTWEVPERYENLQAIGSGAYGNVCSAFDKQTQRKVAIKKLHRPFQTPIHAKRAYREARLLRHMKHDNVVAALDMFSPQKELADFHDVYFVTQLMDFDLSAITKNQTVDTDQICFLVYQILRGIKYIHSAGVIHRDLKPGNLGVREDNDLRILDFGLARQAQDEMTGYVATRWYRAPEIILSWTHYNQTADIWSVGCIMAELITGRPLFPGSDSLSQLKLALELVGSPSAILLEKMSDEAKVFLQDKPHMSARNFRDIFPNADDNAIDLLKLMLELDPDVRVTAEQALAHPYLREWHDPLDEPTCETPYGQGFEHLELPVDDWKGLVFQEVKTFTAV